MALRAECGDIRVQPQRRKAHCTMQVIVRDEQGEVYGETFAECVTLTPEAAAADLEQDARTFLAECEARRALEAQYANVRGVVAARLNPEVA